MSEEGNRADLDSLPEYVPPPTKKGQVTAVFF